MLEARTSADEAQIFVTDAEMKESEKGSSDDPEEPIGSESQSHPAIDDEAVISGPDIGCPAA